MRIVQPKMRSYLRYSNKENGLYQDALLRKDARIISIEDAKSCIGKREATGNNDGMFIEFLQQTVDGMDEREAYCMAGMQTMVGHAELETGRISRIYPTEHCMTCWRSTDADLRVPRSSLKAGDLIIWNHVGTDNGHTGMILEAFADYFNAVEFNTTAGIGSSKQIIRDGGGVYLTQRPYTQVNDMKIVGFLRPFAA